MSKKQSLFPIAYDEISLVDAGGGAADDDSIAPAVLIFKRDGSKVTKLNPVGNNPTIPTSSTSRKKKKKASSSSSSSSSTSSSSKDRISSSGSSSASTKKKKPKIDPCNPKSSTGKKTGKSSQRAKNWNSQRHPRQAGGKFGQTSQQSKQKYGKDGTTKAKQAAECRRRHGGDRIKGLTRIRFSPVGERARKAKGRKFVTKSWNTDARLRALMERKAAR